MYLLLALAVLGYERLSSETNFTIPLVADFVALAVFLFLTPYGFRVVVSVSICGFRAGDAGEYALDAGAGDRGNRRNHLSRGDDGIVRLARRRGTG